MYLIKTASVLAICTIVSGCATQKSTNSDVCPDIKVIAELSKKVWHDDKNVETSRFELDGVLASCRKNNVSEDKNSVHLDVKLQISLMRDNPYQDDTITSAPFLAIVDAKGNVISKVLMPVNISLEKGQKRVSIIHSHEQDLVLPVGVSANQYQALIGYDLTEKEQSAQKAARHKNTKKALKFKSV